MTHWRTHRRHWIPGFGLAAVTRETIVNLAIPEAAVNELPGCSFHQELYTVDRRRLQRHVRREYLSIRREIDDLRANYTSDRGEKR